MSQQSNRPADTPDMDDGASEDVPVTQSATTSRGTASGRGRGRGRWARPKNTKIVKPAQQKATSGRGRRHKVYDNLKVQAAHERTQELKQAFLAVGKLVKPAIQEIADRSVNELLEDPTLYKQVPEYGATKKFLRERREATIRQCDDRLRQGLAMAEHVWKAQRQKVMEEFTIKVAELCEDRYGQLLRELAILEHLYDHGLPVDLPALPDDRYVYKEISEEDAKFQGVFYETEDGIEVPHSGKTISQLMVKPQTLPLEPKRKPEGQPEGQPAAKTAAVNKGDEATPQLPRHPAGLLGAADAIEESEATTPDTGSNAPTPTPAPEPAEEAVPERINQQPASGAVTPPDGPELPIPRGATEPDEFGVRLISRRPTRLDIPNNRIMVPNLFEWDDLEIGFRDSTNCAQKGATKQRRGKYLGRPGSNYMFIDRRAGIWDSTLAAGELDEELVKKYGLHPTLGIVLPTSVNEWEPPKPYPDGWKPVVFVPPNGGDPIHTSRTIEPARRDAETEAVQRRMEIARLLRTICEQEGIPPTDLAPDEEIMEKNRAEILAARGLDPAQVFQPEPSPPTPQPAEEDRTVFDSFVGEALGAAAAIEAEEEAARAAATKRSQTSRPYDAIRDVFTESPSTRVLSPPSAQETPPPAVPRVPDTTNLSCLADLALRPGPTVPSFAVVDQSPQREVPPPLPSGPIPPAPQQSQQPQQPQPPQPPRQPQQQQQQQSQQQQQQQQQQHQHQQPQQPNGLVTRAEYERQQRGYTPRPAEFSQPEPAQLARHETPSAPVEPARTNDFLRTALNPQPASPPPPPMPPVHEYGGVPLAPAPGPMPPQPPQAPPSRTPFSSTGTTKGLPALRPMRTLLNEPTPYPNEPQSNPGIHHNMVTPNSGTYYPPTTSRPFHNTFSIQDQGQPMQPMMPQQQLGAPLQAPPHTGAPMAPAPLRRMSTPPQYHQSAGPPLGPAPGPGVGTQTPMHFQGQQPLAPRSRPGSSSATNSAASSKYRKLEPAPTPPHRLAYSGNGQELRTVQFDYREAIKDYSAIEAPPRHGPTQIRGWTHNNIRKVARPTSSSSKTDSAGGGGGTHVGTGLAGKKGSAGKRERADDVEEKEKEKEMPRKKLKSVEFALIRRFSDSLPAHDSSPISFRSAGDAKTAETNPPVGAPVSTPLLLTGDETRSEVAGNEEAANRAATAPREAKAKKKSRALSATPSVPNRSPYNLRRRRGTTNADTKPDTDPKDDLGSGP
ncbi:hypothetical protein VTH82DRAFT_1140 [Thermothelomyces myriococcoides]